MQSRLIYLTACAFVLGCGVEGHAPDEGQGATVQGARARVAQTTEETVTEEVPTTPTVSDGTSTTASSLIFVTSTLYRPGVHFSGIAGADAICAAKAAEVGLTGTFVAVLSDSTSDAAARLSISYPVVTTNGDLIESQDLFSGLGIVNRIRTEAGALSANWVWTGCRADGTVGVTDCRDWTYPFSLDRGTHADSSATDSLWLGHDGNGGLCDNSFALYCIGQ